MAVTLMRQESTAIFDAFADAPEACMIGELYEEDQTEALQFLAARPIHTVFMSSLIRDNGLTSPHNRGSFDAGRSADGSCAFRLRQPAAQLLQRAINQRRARNNQSVLEALRQHRPGTSLALV